MQSFLNSKTKQNKTFSPPHHHGFGFTNKDLEEGCLDSLNPTDILPVLTVFAASTTGNMKKHGIFLLPMLYVLSDDNLCS